MKPVSKVIKLTSLFFSFISLLTVVLNWVDSSAIKASSVSYYKLEYTQDADDILPIDAENAVKLALNAWTGPAPFDGTFLVGSLRWEQTWALAALAPKTSLESQDDMDSFFESFFSLVLVRTSTGWQAAIDTDPNAKALIQLIPDTQLSQNAKLALFPLQIGGESTGGQQFFGYKFPWPSGQPWRVTYGWHEDGHPPVISSTSLDLDILGANNSDILAAAAGTAGPIVHCPGGHAYLPIITSGTNGEFLAYFHLTSASLQQAGIMQGINVQQGQKLGIMGGVVNNSCAVAYATHLHLKFSTVPFIIDGVEFTESNYHSGENLYSTQSQGQPPDTTIISSPQGWVASSVTITWQGTPPNNLVYRYRLVGYENWSSWTGATSKTYGSEVLPHGWHTFEVQAKDQHGNVDGSPATVSFGVDRLRPDSPTIFAGGTNCNTAQNNVWQNSCRDIAFNWTATDAGSGIRDYRYAWSNNPATSPATLTTATTYDPGPIAPVDGYAQYYFNIKAYDNVNRESGISTFGLWYDGTKPQVTSFAINNGAPTTSLVDLSLNLIANDTGSGVGWVQASNNGVSWSDWLPYDEAIPWSLPAFNNYTHTVYLRVSDIAGNLSTVVTDTIRLQLYPPAPHSANYRICQSVFGSGGSSSPVSTGFRVTANIGEPAINNTNGSASSGYTTYGGFLANNDGCLPINEPIPFGYGVTHSVIASGGNIRNSNSYEMGDTLGQPMASGATVMSSSNFTLVSGFWSSITGTTPLTGSNYPGLTISLFDTENQALPPSAVGTFPSEFTVLINQGATYTSNSIVTVNLQAPNVTEMRLAYDAVFTNSIWQTYQMTTTWGLVENISVLPQAIYVQFRDASNNVYGPFVAEIVYDPIAPAGTLTLLGNDVGPDIDLYMEAWDGNSGINLVRVADNPDFNNATWQPFIDFIPWTLNQPYVYVQFQDLAGSNSGIYSNETSESAVYLPLIIR